MSDNQDADSVHLRRNYGKEKNMEAMRAELEKYKALETLEHSRGKEAEKEEQARK